MAEKVFEKTGNRIGKFAYNGKNDIEGYPVYFGGYPVYFLRGNVFEDVDCYLRRLGTAVHYEGGEEPLSIYHFNNSTIRLSMNEFTDETVLSIIGNSEETLKKHGAVSEETVIEMVSGVQKLFNSDCAIATTGIAGPTGATAEKPVGLCYLAARVGDQQVSRKFQFGNDRLMNKRRGAIAALELLRRLLLNIQ